MMWEGHGWVRGSDLGNGRCVPGAKPR